LVHAGRGWRTHGDHLQGAELWRTIAQATWECGDPACNSTPRINAWHTCPNTARINASNPCSEYMFLDNSACKSGIAEPTQVLAPRRHLRDRCLQACDRDHHLGARDHRRQRALPDTEIEANSLRFRPLGLGYANLGSLIMSLGLPYDSAPRGWRPEHGPPAGCNRAQFFTAVWALLVVARRWSSGRRRPSRSISRAT